MSDSADWAFTPENMEKVKAIVAKYPDGRQQSAVMPLLDLAQRQHGTWIPHEAMDHIADLLDMAPIRVYEVATFYTMYNTKPVGQFHIQTCMTTPCWLRGIDAINKAITDHLGIGLGESSADGKWTITPVECLGACCNAPMVQINDDFFEDLTPESIVAVLTKLANGEEVKTGSQIGRIGSEPVGERQTLLEQPKSPAAAEPTIPGE